MTLYTSKVVAQWLCLTERRVRQLRDEGVIVEARPGLYELQPTVARYITYIGGAGKDRIVGGLGAAAEADEALAMRPRQEIRRRGLGIECGPVEVAGDGIEGFRAEEPAGRHPRQPMRTQRRTERLATAVDSA